MGRRTRLYMAYGSNMNLEQMADRCRTAEVVGKGILKNYELLFRGARHGAVATVEPREGSSVPVVLWEIGARDEVALDCYEGYPRLYREADDGGGSGWEMPAGHGICHDSRTGIWDSIGTLRRNHPGGIPVSRF